MSLITNYPIIRREIFRAAGNNIKKSINKYIIKPTFHETVISVFKNLATRCQITTLDVLYISQKYVINETFMMAKLHTLI
jgi:hypothetical protein